MMQSTRIVFLIFYLLFLIGTVIFLIYLKMGYLSDRTMGPEEHQQNENLSIKNEKKLELWHKYIIDNTKFYQNGKNESINYANGQIDRVYAIVLPNRKIEFEKRMKSTGLLDGIWELQAFPKDKVDFKELINIGMIDKNFFYAYENKARVCCHLSHLACLLHFLKSGLKTALILEDDPVVMDDYTEKHTNEVLSIANNEYSNWNIFYLSYNLEIKNSKEHIKGQKVWKLNRPFGRHAYVVKPSGAQIIVNETLPQHGPGDVNLTKLIKEKKLIAYGVEERIFNSDQRKHGSELNNDMKMKSGIPPQFSDFKDIDGKSVL